MKHEHLRLQKISQESSDKVTAARAVLTEEQEQLETAQRALEAASKADKAKDGEAKDIEADLARQIQAAQKAAADAVEEGIKLGLQHQTMTEQLHVLTSDAAEGEQHVHSATKAAQAATEAAAKAESDRAQAAEAAATASRELEEVKTQTWDNNAAAGRINETMVNSVSCVCCLADLSGRRVTYPCVRWR